MAGLQDNTPRIVLVGKTRSRKSATANIIFGRRKFVSKIAPHTVTKSCQRASEVWKGRNPFVLDITWVFVTKETLKTTCEEISECVLFSYLGPKPSSWFYSWAATLRKSDNSCIDQDPLWGASHEAHDVLFTRKDDLGDHMLPAFIAASEIILHSIIRKCGNCCCAFNNKQSADAAEKEAQVQELVELIEEMVQRNGGAHFSETIYKDVGKKLQREAEALKIIYEDQLQKENKLVEELCAQGKISEQ